MGSGRVELTGQVKRVPLDLVLDDISVSIEYSARINAVDSVDERCFEIRSVDVEFDSVFVWNGSIWTGIDDCNDKAAVDSYLGAGAFEKLNKACEANALLVSPVDWKEVLQ